MGYVKAKALLKTLPAVLEQARPRETLGDLLSDAEAQALADTVADTLPKAKA